MKEVHIKMDENNRQGNTINSLADQKLITPVTFTYEGVYYVANSMFAACEFLKEKGYYNNKSLVEFKF